MLLDAPLVLAGDYAASIGTTGLDYQHVYPAPLPPGPPPNGAFRAVIGVRFREIKDGLSNTLLVGDKHVARGWETFQPSDCGIWDGHNPVCHTRAAGPQFPLPSSANDTGWKFGSRHPGLCQFVFADGSVRSLQNSIKPTILGLLAQRNDGQAIPEY